MTVEGSSQIGIDGRAADWLEMVVCWGIQWGFHFREKMNVMLLKGRHSSVRLRGAIVAYAEQVWYLGAVGSERLGFHDYL